MSERNIHLDHAEISGELAFIEGFPVESNPYSTLETYHAPWRLGWLKASQKQTSETLDLKERLLGMTVARDAIQKHLAAAVAEGQEIEAVLQSEIGETTGAWNVRIKAGISKLRADLAACREALENIMRRGNGNAVWAPSSAAELARATLARTAP